MITPILTTKLYIPSTRPDHLQRPRLIEKLNSGIFSKLTLISAPAGFGKSTLLSAWVRPTYENSRSEDLIQPTRVAWLSLDEGDNDLRRFLLYFVAALQTVEPDIGESVMTLLQSTGAVDLENFLTILLNELAAISVNMVLILDDYHIIESAPIDQAITFILDHLPAKIHLVIASRMDPSLPLSRMRARGQIIEIRANDLRFRAEEAAVLLNDRMGLNLSTSDVEALEARTEGWIAGLQLAALAIHGRPSFKKGDRGSDAANFIHRFTGSDRYIHDYLTDEVLQQQSKTSKDFLLQTSILKGLNAALCQAVTEKSDCQDILERFRGRECFHSATGQRTELVSLSPSFCRPAAPAAAANLSRSDSNPAQPGQ